MLKLWGAILIAVSFIALGDKAAKFKRHRLDFLEEMLAVIYEFRTAIELFSLAVPRALEKCGIDEIYCRAKRENAVNSEDCKDFDFFSKGLKAETLPGQLANIEIYEKKLKAEEKEEREKYKKEAKLIRGGFMLFGFLVVIMLL